MQSISILGYQVFQQSKPFHFDQSHVSEGWDRTFGIHDVLIRLVLDSLGLFLPSSRPCLQHRADTRSEIRDPTGSGNASPSKSNKMIALKDKAGNGLNLLLEDIGRVKVLDLVFLLLVRRVSHW